MREFIYIPEGFRFVRAKLMRMLGIIFVVIFILAGILPIILSGEHYGWGTLPVMALIIAVVAALSLKNATDKQRQIFKSFRLKIDEEKITLSRKDLADLVILHSEVKSITKKRSGNIVIKGRTPHHTIYIFPCIDQPAELERLLNEINPVRYAGGKINELWFFPISVLTIAAIGGFSATRDGVIRFVCMAVFIAAMVVGFHISSVNKNTDRTTKLLSLAIFIPLIVILCYMIFR
jgi:hypothetical protein